jgi:hypothetical protein
MPNNLQVEPGTPGMASLVGGIINDAQTLVRQEITLAKTEIQQEFTKTKEAAASLGIGGVVTFLGGIFLCFMLVHLLHWLTLRPDATNYDPAQLPLWACHGIVGFLLALAGGVVLYRGVAKASAIQIPPPQTTESLKEIV